jgi:rhamnogalacturonan endolyase
MKKKSSFVVFLLMLLIVKAQVTKQEKTPDNASLYKKGKLLFKDDFDNDLKNWITEFPKTPASSVAINNKKLVVNVDGGATLWLNKKLSGNLIITYKRKVLVEGGKNDRLSDLNQFWMATDPKRKNLFTRTGVLSEYDSLQLYYVGFGGNTNKTTRFRKYTGNGERVLYIDLNDADHLLKANKEYCITTIVYNGITKFFVDDREFFSFKDNRPLKEGYFGFRTTQSRQEIDDFEVYQFK